jgi:hypothetical protein
VAELLPAMLDAVEVLRRGRRVDAYVILAPTFERKLV